MDRRELLRKIGFLPLALLASCSDRGQADFEIYIDPPLTDQDREHINELWRSGKDDAIVEYISKRMKIRPVKGR